ncbi:hypothetical protein E4U21_006722 [Claviceps maximensis]|nr:hypothetical protein E4U21_006722 [Claviceps maximensis]
MAAKRESKQMQPCLCFHGIKSDVPVSVSDATPQLRSKLAVSGDDKSPSGGLCGSNSTPVREANANEHWPTLANTGDIVISTLSSCGWDLDIASACQHAAARYSRQL